MWVELGSEEILTLGVYAEMIEGKIIKAQDNYQVVISGTISSLGTRDATQGLTKVSIEDSLIYDSADSPMSAVNAFELLSIMNDSVLFIDYDRYFKDEFESKDVQALLPGSFRNWLFNLSLANDRRQEFDDILKTAREFKITTTDAKFKENEKSSPFHKKIDYRFARIEAQLELFLRNEFGELPLSSFGTGVQQLLYLIFKIAEARPKILLIEEIELNLSPKYQDLLIKYFETLIAAGQIINQAFITSHSPLHCYRTQHRSYLAKINGNGETTFQKFVLPEAEIKKLKAAHAFLVKSFYGITAKKEL